MISISSICSEHLVRVRGSQVAGGEEEVNYCEREIEGGLRLHPLLLLSAVITTNVHSRHEELFA